MSRQKAPWEMFGKSIEIIVEEGGNATVKDMQFVRSKPEPNNVDTLPLAGENGNAAE